MRRTLLLLGLVLGLSSSCATLSPTSQSLPTLDSVPPYQGEMTPELMHAILLAELAVKRGELEVAVDRYLFAARYTHDAQLAERATRVAFYAKHDQDALEAARIWEQAEPDNPDITQVLALLYLRNSQVDTSLAYWRRIISGHGEPERVFEQMGRVLAGEENRDAVLALMQGLSKEYGQLPEAQLTYARLALEAKQYPQAEAALDRALALRPNWWQVHVLRAQLYQQTGQAERAEQSMGAAVLARPTDNDLRLRYARLLFEHGKFKEAKAQFQELLRLKPEDADIRFALGILHMQLQELDAARGHFLQLISQGRRLDDASYYLGQIAEARQKTEEAKQWYGQVREGENVYPAVRRLLFIMAKEDGLEPTLRYLHRLSSESATDAVRLVTLEGDLLNTAGEYQRAFDVYSQALESYPDAIDVLYSRAMVAEKLDKLDILERDLREVLHYDPNNADAMNALGYTLADRTDRYKEAHQLIQRALELKPGSPPILDSMGWVLYRLKRYDEAVDYLQRAYRVIPDAEVAAHLGEALWAQGRHDEARKVWTEALQREPQHPLLQRVMEKYRP